MKFADTGLFSFLYELVLCFMFFGLMAVLLRSAIDSFKRARKWRSVADEVVVGLFVLGGFAIFTNIIPSVVLETCANIVYFFGNLVKAFFVAILGLPL